MTPLQVANLAEAAKTVEWNMSPRARCMANLERFVDGTAYDGMPDFWAADSKVPLVDRKPCIVYPIVRTAIDSNVDLLLGDGRFPVLTSRPDEDDDFEDSGELDEEQSCTLDAFIKKVHQQTRFRPVCREVFAAAQGCGSACALLGVRAGKLFVESVKARWCEPEFDLEGNVVRLVIQYPYIDQVKENNQWVAKPKLYRRVIDDANDTTFLPADARMDSTEIEWKVDASKTVRHSLGFCPVVWYAHMRGCAAVGDFDGKAIHAHLLDEIKAHDTTLSQRQRAGYYAGDPQWTEVGVDSGYNPSSDGVRGGGISSTVTGGPPSKDNPITGQYRAQAQSRKVRKKSPGDVWQYDSKDVKVTLHTLPADALKALDEIAHDLRQKIAESLCVVFMDPENVKFAATVSGKALETLRQRQLDRCDQFRSDFGDGFILPATSMLLRIVSKLGEAVRVPGLSVALPVVSLFEGGDVEAA